MWPAWDSGCKRASGMKEAHILNEREKERAPLFLLTYCLLYGLLHFIVTILGIAGGHFSIQLCNTLTPGILLYVQVLCECVVWASRTDQNGNEAYSSCELYVLRDQLNVICWTKIVGIGLTNLCIWQYPCYVSRASGNMTSRVQRYNTTEMCWVETATHLSMHWTVVMLLMQCTRLLNLLRYLKEDVLASQYWLDNITI